MDTVVTDNFGAMLCSNTTEQLDIKLASAQAEIGGAAKSATNPAFRSKYAKLEDVIEAYKEVLGKHQLTLSQWPLESQDGSTVRLATRIAHKGEWIISISSAPLVKKDAQGVGSCLTYLRRYAAMAALGIPAEDDDGNEASRPNPPPKKQAYREPPITEADLMDPGNMPGLSTMDDGPSLRDIAERARIRELQEANQETKFQSPTTNKKPLLNTAYATITAPQRAYIQKMAKEKNVDLIRFLDPKMIDNLSQQEAYDFSEKLKAMSVQR